LDQTRLPGQEVYLDLCSPEEIAEAISALRVRGAPAIGIAAAYGVALGFAPDTTPGTPIGPQARMADLDRLLRATRPTAVNLAWALDRMARVVSRGVREGLDAGDGLHSLLVHEARAIHEEDREACLRIGEAGLTLFPPRGRGPEGAVSVLTHCNAGALATGGIGTALAPVYLAHREGRRVHVFARETRPVLQGARLTAWELRREGVGVTVLPDAAGAALLASGQVDLVLVGADRIAANGDVANKIGTLGLALAARFHEVPFYVAAPSSTLDPETAEGAEIPIEERDPEELRGTDGARTIPAGAAVWNPAFDVTPAELITGFITENGVARTPLLNPPGECGKS